MRTQRTMGAALALLLLLGSATASGITRDEILTRAKSYADEVWTSKPQNTQAWCTTGYETDYPPGTYTGLPYDWGGYVELDQFQDELAAGFAAGSHSWHGVLSCSTGVDCSGYVSKCWKGPHKSTSTMHTITTPITAATIAKGDAWNDAGSHMVLWVGQADDGAPLFYEASGSGKKVRLNTAASWSYLNGYVPIRYEYVSEGGGTDAAGTQKNPFAIASFPYHHEYSTLATGTAEIDSYSCMPDKGAENGPEVLYRIDLIQPGLLSAVVSDGSGVDVDLHLLSALDPNACVERHDTTIGPVELEPGTWWLVADSWSSTSGQTWPGAYVLDVTFEATGPVPDPGDTDPTDAGAGGGADAGGGEPDAGGGEPDAGAAYDAGSTDAGSWADSGTGADTANTSDSQVTEPDAAAPLDSGSFVVPGAPDATGDGFAGPDPVGKPPSHTAAQAAAPDGGCSTPGSAAPTAPLALLLALALLRRRARAF